MEVDFSSYTEYHRIVHPFFECSIFSHISTPNTVNLMWCMDFWLNDSIKHDFNNKWCTYIYMCVCFVNTFIYHMEMLWCVPHTVFHSLINIGYLHWRMWNPFNFIYTYTHISLNPSSCETFALCAELKPKDALCVIKWKGGGVWGSERPSLRKQYKESCIKWTMCLVIIVIIN